MGKRTATQRRQRKQPSQRAQRRTIREYGEADPLHNSLDQEEEEGMGVGMGGDGNDVLALSRKIQDRSR